MAAALRAVLLLAVALSATAQELPLAALGDLQLEYAPPRAVQGFPGGSLPARAGYRPGSAFDLRTPRAVQRVEYLVEPGAKLAGGEPLARLSGPEVHHFLLEFEASAQRLEMAEQRYDSNLALYRRQAVPESQWIEVSENYRAARLEHEHLRHFRDLVLQSDDETDSLIIAAPVAGVVDYTTGAGGIGGGQSIALFYPPDDLRLEVQLPNGMRGMVTALRAPRCEVPLESVAEVSSGFFVSAWSGRLADACELLPGQETLVQPLLGGEAYRLPRGAVFQWQGGSHILLRAGDTLQAVAVEVLGSAGGDYILGCQRALSGREALITSVSAAQGILLGLGSE